MNGLASTAPPAGRDTVDGRRSCAQVMAQLAVHGVVASIAGSASGELGVLPRSLSLSERQELDVDPEGQALVFEVGDGKLFLHSDGACTTLWFDGAGSERAIDLLEAALLSAYPAAVRVRDDSHESNNNLRLRTFEVRLANDHLAVVDAVYPLGALVASRFMIRITAMARQN